MSHDGVRPRSVPRSVAFLTTGVLAVSALAGCGSEDEPDGPAAAQDIAPAARGRLADSGTVHWAVDAMPQTLNAFQADADAATSRIAGAVLPAMFELDERGRPQRDSDFLESAKVVERKPRQVVLYKLSQQAVWSDGREIGAADFAAQWRALSGKDSAYWTARNAGYDRIQKIERGADDLEVRVTFGKPYADWRSLFSPLYPKDVMGTPAGFNDGARNRLKVTAGPFSLAKVDGKAGEVTLKRNPRWWGQQARLSEIVLRAVPRGKRAAALAAGTIDVAEVDPSEAERVTKAGSGKAGSGPRNSAPRAGSTPAASQRSSAETHAHGEKAEEEKTAKERTEARAKDREAVAKRKGHSHFEIRKSLEPAYTQLALNGSEGPLADERVRRAVARAIDRDELARLVLHPLGLPATTVGSHLALAGQAGYTDGSGALGKQDTAEARSLLADAGWVRGGTAEKETKAAEKDKAAKSPRRTERTDGTRKGDAGSESGSAKPDDHSTGSARDGVGDDDKAGEHTNAEERTAARAEAGQDGARHVSKGGAPGEYAPKGTAAPAGAATGMLTKNGKPLTLRFVLPSGPGSESLRTVGGRISRMLERIGIRTEMSKVADDSYFNDHVASGQYDLALYSWPASAFPATDARPIFAKPVPGADGSLNVEQNYTRIGTDHIDQLFDQAMGELDDGKAQELMRKADARIWAEAGSIPLYQRPQLVAVRSDLANVGAFGFETPHYEDIGFVRNGAQGPPPAHSASPSHHGEPGTRASSSGGPHE